MKVIKEETLDKAALKWFMTANKREIIFDLGWIKIFEAGAKWQSERMYSEEEVLNFTQTMIQQYKFGNTNIEQLGLLKETLQIFKKNKI